MPSSLKRPFSSAVVVSCDESTRTRAFARGFSRTLSYTVPTALAVFAGAGACCAWEAIGTAARAGARITERRGKTRTDGMLHRGEGSEPRRSQNAGYARVIHVTVAAAIYESGKHPTHRVDPYMIESK